MNATAESCFDAFNAGDAAFCTVLRPEGHPRHPETCQPGQTTHALHV